MRSRMRLRIESAGEPAHEPDGGNQREEQEDQDDRELHRRGVAGIALSNPLWAQTEPGSAGSQVEHHQQRNRTHCQRSEQQYPDDDAKQEHVHRQRRVPGLEFPTRQIGRSAAEGNSQDQLPILHRPRRARDERVVDVVDLGLLYEFLTL